MAAPVAVSYDPAQNLVKQQTSAFNSLLNQQNTQQQGLFNQYTSAVNSQPKLADVLTNAEQQRGLGDLQNGINLFNDQSQGVKGLIDRLNENTQARTSGTNANQAYLDRMRAVEGGGLNTQLSRLTEGLAPLTQAYGLASQDIGQLVSATQSDQANHLKPLELQINSMGDKFARQITGYTTNSQNALNVLLSKIQNQQSLNNQEWQAAQDLAKQEQAFQQQRSLIADQSSSTNTFLGAGLTGKQTGVGSAISRDGGGFNFTNAAGQPTSAAAFAAANKTSIGDLLYRMGQSGDQTAANAYNWIKYNQGTDFAKSGALETRLKQNYPSLFWGT